MSRETLQDAVSRTISQWIAAELNELVERLGGTPDQVAVTQAPPLPAAAADAADSALLMNARLRAIEDRVGRISSNRSAAVREAASANLGVAVR